MVDKYYSREAIGKRITEKLRPKRSNLKEKLLSVSRRLRR